ncbi:hypothetical protein SAMN05444004_10221 [Jannaschia faecimaris]|uniref:DUF4168 domain-containing protein n=1 Tax=Jannaschia faecimaris TaxID=1244108 RepID=A0A1H3KXR2_9RHOB|nr:hypothetical protein [Jannaschia faecimaris]SDY56942.1 hypothetical protein SAMN05444004_10221 [Jannaschia faecimaris]
MTRFTVVTAAALTATSAAAYTGVSPTIVESVETTLAGAAYEGYSVEQMSDAQVLEIYLATTSTDNVNAGTGRIDAVLAELRDPEAETVVVTPEEAARIKAARDAEPSVVETVQAQMNTRGIEIDVSTLTDAQVAELYFLTSSESESQQQRTEIETIIANG